MVCAFWKIALIFLYSVCLLVSSEDNRKKKCELPPNSFFGGYFTNKRASPGDEVDSVLLYYLCSGYGISGTPGVLCSNGIWSHNPPHRECLPYCNMENDTKVVTCGLGRCIPEPYPRPRPFMPPVGVDVGLTFRNKDQDDCGKPRVEVVFGYTGTLEPVLVTSWHASIYTKTTKPYTRTCGGSLVTKSIVISAAHCFWGDDEQLPVENYAVAVGKRHFKWDGPRELYQTSNVREVKIPPGFRGAETNFQDDIALVIVTLPFIFTPDVQPVCLNFDHELEKTQLVHENIGHVPGWDVPTDGEEKHLWLKAADLPFVDKEKCIEDSPTEFVPSITADKMCVGHKNSTVLCANDSGSGLVFLGGGAESRFYLRGVMTTPSDYHGNNTCHANVWATATKISSHERFIKDNMPDIFN